MYLISINSIISPDFFLVVIAFHWDIFCARPLLLIAQSSVTFDQITWQINYPPLPLQAEKNKSRSGSLARDELSGEAGDDGGEGIEGEDEGAGTDLEHDPNETMEDYEAALDTET